MTLLRQISLALFAVVLVVVAGALAINVRATRAFLEQQLSAHSQDTATSLGVSLSSAAGQGDLAVVQLLTDAVFDRGAYRSVTVTDASGRVVHRREVAPAPAEVPAWFAAALPLRGQPGEAVIMDGWRQVGHVRVDSHPGPAYAQLWRSTRQSAVLMAGAAIGALGVAWLLVGVILRPLAQVEAQAHSIAARDFSHVAPLPGTRELRRVVGAMNDLSARVRRMLDEHIALTEQARTQAFADPVTGLANRLRFNAELEQLTTDPEHPPGALVLVQVANLATINARQGYGAGDAVLQAAGPAIAQAGADCELRCAARLGGGDFALLLATAHTSALEALGSALGAALAGLHAAGVAPDADVGHVGIAVFQPGDTGRTLLARADRAMRTAQESGANRHVLLGAQAAALGAHDAARVLREALDAGDLVLWAQPVLSLRQHGTVVHHEILARIRTADGLLPVGAFMSAAQRFGLAQALDRAVIAQVVAQVAGRAGPKLAVNVCPDSVRDNAFSAWLGDLLHAHPGAGARLSFEVSEYGAAHDPASLERFGTTLRALGSTLGLDHFGRGFHPFGYLATLRPAYLKVDGSHIRGVAHSADGRFFLRALGDVAHALDALLIAESVEHADEHAAIVALGADAAQGWHLGEPKPLEGVLAG